jgi:transcriptional regulator with GAF, ATPase, and Fis domain
MTDNRGESPTPNLALLTQTFVDLADTLVDDFDVLDLLHGLTSRCVELLGVDAAGVMLADRRGTLRVAAASSERTRLLELFELQNDEGPCLDCFRSGAPASYPDLATESNRWPRFVAYAQRDGFHAAHAVPLRLRHEVIGAMNLFWHDPFAMRAADGGVAQAFADVATIAILQERLVHTQGLVATQLQTALDSRVVIEQAKGILAERMGYDMQTAFATLRDSARRNHRRLSDLAREMVESRGGGTLPD